MNSTTGSTSTGSGTDDRTIRPPDVDQVGDERSLRAAVEALGPEPAACLVCGGSELRAAFVKQGKTFWSCGGCELVFVHDIYPEFVQDLDALDYLETAELRPEPKPRERADFARLLDGFEGVRRSGRLLEIGCGNGLFLGVAQQRGWDCTGLEILPQMANYTRERYGIDVRTQTLREAGFANGAFDVVYANEVIEHVVDPIDLMRRVRAALRPGGLAVLRTGNAGSWSARLQRRRWWYYHFGGHGHIRFFTPRTARALADAAGYAGVTCSTRGFAFVEGIDLRGHWYRPIVRLGQSLISPFAGPCGAGHRLTMRFQA